MAEKLTYRVHDMASVFPLPTPEEYAAIKANVQQIGFIFPKVMWKDEKGATWLIDGRTRDRVETELSKAGVEKAENGKSLTCPVAMFSGTEADAVDYVRGINLTRRAMTPAQKAAAAILSGSLSRMYKLKAEGRDVSDDSEEEGDTATRLADQAGTNRAYIFDCQKLYKENPDLLQNVLSAAMSIPEAKKVAGRRKEGLPDKPPEAGETPIAVEPQPAKKEEEIYDGLKNVVHEDQVAAFKIRDQVRAHRKVLNTLIASIEADCEAPGGKMFSLQAMKSDLSNCRRHLEDHQPHAPCPYCSGTGRDPEQPPDGRKKCNKCKGRKWMDRLQWKEVPAELRAIFEGRTVPASTPEKLPEDEEPEGDGEGESDGNDGDPEA